MLESGRPRLSSLADRGVGGTERGRRRLARGDSGVDRRAFLRALSGMGVAGAALSAVTGETDVPADEVVRLHRHEHANPRGVGDGEPPARDPVYDSTPVRDWVRVRAPWNAAERLVDRLNRPASLGYGVFYEGSEPRIGLHYDASAGFERRLEDLRRRVPASVDGTASYDGSEYTVEGIPVSVEELRIAPQSYFGGVYRPIPGGCQITDSWANRFTLGAPAWDTVANEPGWLTSGHCVDYERNYWVFQPFGGAPVGKTSKVSPPNSGDCAFVASAGPERAFDVASTRGGYADEYVCGALAADSLRDKAAAGDAICSQGTTSSRTSGALRGILRFGGCEWVVFDDLLTRGGDSGGPYFWIDDADRVYVAGINCGGMMQDGSWRTFGQTAYSIESQLDVVI